MRLILAIAVLVMPLAANADQPKAPNSFKLALLCLKTGEQTSGLNKICYYNCAGSGAAITVRLTELCPLSIDR
jgi:hypothetical protein